MRYKNPIPKKHNEADRISSLWELSTEWKTMIARFVFNNKDNPFISLDLVPNHKKYSNTAQLQDELSMLILLVLYFEIPHQMGHLEIIRLNQKQSTLWGNDQKAFSKHAMSLQKQLKELIQLADSNLIEADFEHLKDWLELSYKQVESIENIISNRIVYNPIEYLDRIPQQENPLFNRKYNTPTALRDLVMKYINLIILTLKLEFKSTYQKYKFIHHLLQKIFSKDSKSFDLMENIQIMDLKNYIKDSDFSNPTSHIHLFSNLECGIAEIDEAFSLLHEHAPPLNFQSLPTIYPYIKEYIKQDSSLSWVLLNTVAQYGYK
ncbi:MAG: hypothetical protein ACRC9L_01360 [Brevinema sp.]